MNITDETLSAFLDSELSEADMDAVRNQLMDDPTLTDRLAEFAAVDMTLQQHYSAIDDRPLPQSIQVLLAPSTVATPSADIVAFPWWRRARHYAGQSIAAALVVGFAVSIWMNTPDAQSSASSSLVAVLEHQQSGIAHAVEDDLTITPRLTFRNTAGTWCRQYRAQQAGAFSEAIACRDTAGRWEIVAHADVDVTAHSERYMTASGGNVLDETLDQLMAAQPIDIGEERALIDNGWRN